MSVNYTFRRMSTEYEAWYLNINDRHFIYVPRSARIYECNYGAVEAQERGMYVPDLLLRNSTVVVRRNAIPAIKNRDSFHISFAITRDCTLRCLYCHAYGGLNADISLEKAQAILRWCARQAGQTKSKQLNVSFAVGGEPSIRWQLFQDVINYGKQLMNEKFAGMEKILFSMVTNGIYEGEKRDWIINNVDNLNFSYDGLPDVQNRNRPLANGENSSDIAIATFKRFLELKPEYHLSIRATISNESYTRLPEMVQFLYDTFGGGEKVRFHLESLVEVGRGANSVLKAPPELAYAQAVHDVLPLAKELGVHVFTADARLDTFRHGSFCAMSSLGTYITINGDMTACYRDSDGEMFKFGTFDFEKEEAVIDENLKNKLLDFARMPDSCRDCFVNANCHGDCPDVRYNNVMRCDGNRLLVVLDILDSFNDPQQVQPSSTPMVYSYIKIGDSQESNNCSNHCSSHV